MSWVTDPTNELILHLVDAKGTRATDQYWVAPTEVDPTTGAPAAIATAVQNISADEVASVEVLRRASWNLPVVPTDGPYPRSADKLKIEFAGADGSVTIMELPALLETLLDSGKINVDPANSTWTTNLATLLTKIVSSEGAALIAVKKAYRRRPPRLKKQ